MNIILVLSEFTSRPTSLTACDRVHVSFMAFMLLSNKLTHIKYVTHGEEGHIIFKSAMSMFAS
jgi:hypothetical protein